MVNGVQISKDFNIIVRKDALAQRGISRLALLTAMEMDAPLDEDDMLMSFGPLFGEEASLELSHRLEALGLRAEEDFFGFAPTIPDWCALRIVFDQ